MATAVVLALALCSCGTAPTSSASVQLTIRPGTQPVAEPPLITVSGIGPDTRVTIAARTHDVKGLPWVSAATFMSSSSGTVNVATSVPVSGSYRVADPGGLLWSLHPSSRSEHGSQFYVGGQFAVDLQVSVDGNVVARGTMIRSTTAPGETSERLTMTSSGFVGTLLMPGHIPAARPLVVVLGGSAGGEPLLPATALAAQGVPALALAYFGEPGLPSCLCDIPLEYFEHVLDWVKSQPATEGRPVVLLGSSRGAEAALLVADTYPQDLNGLILGSPTDTVHGHFGGSGSAWTLGGEMITSGELIPVGAITVPVLIGAGGRDTVWNSAASAASIISGLPPVSTGSAQGHIDLTYPKAGHMFIAPPYIPYVVAGEGGSELDDQLALQSFWPQLTEFIEKV